jgi:hypothetical protein
MGYENQNINVPDVTAYLPFATCDSKAREGVFEDATRQLGVDAVSCDCPNCLNLASAGRPSNISPLVAIDVYGLPDETTYSGLPAC